MDAAQSVPVELGAHGLGLGLNTSDRETVAYTFILEVTTTASKPWVEHVLLEAIRRIGERVEPEGLDMVQVKLSDEIRQLAVFKMSPGNPREET